MVSSGVDYSGDLLSEAGANSDSREGPGGKSPATVAAESKFKSLLDKARHPRKTMFPGDGPKEEGNVLMKPAGTALDLAPEEQLANDKLKMGDHANLETASSYFGDDRRDNENFRKELEKLQIATIFSLVEQVPMDNGTNINLLFLTNSQANEFDFKDINKVLFFYLDIIPPAPVCFDKHFIFPPVSF